MNDDAARGWLVISRFQSAQDNHFDLPSDAAAALVDRGWMKPQGSGVVFTDQGKDITDIYAADYGILLEVFDS